MLHCNIFSAEQLTSPTQTYLEIIMLTAEQILAAQKANIETLFGLTHQGFEGVEKLVELNVTATKAALAEAAEPPKPSWASRTRKNCWPCKPPVPAPGREDRRLQPPPV
jgi:hypothetical protein